MSFVFLLLSPMQLLGDGEALAYCRSLPLALVALTLVFGLAYAFTGRYRGFLLAMVFLSCSYGFAVNVFDSAVTASTRQANTDFTDGLSVVKDGSALFFGDQYDYVLLGPLKGQKRIILVDTSIDGQAGSAALLSHYYRERVPVYLYESNESSYLDFMRTSLSAYDGRTVREEYPRIYLVEAKST